MVDGHGDNASLMVIVKLEMTVKVVIVLVMVFVGDVGCSDGIYGRKCFLFLHQVFLSVGGIC